jgi:hypothetical protein
LTARRIIVRNRSNRPPVVFRQQDSAMSRAVAEPARFDAPLVLAL